LLARAFVVAERRSGLLIVGMWKRVGGLGGWFLVFGRVLGYATAAQCCG